MEPTDSKSKSEFSRQVSQKEKRKLKALKDNKRSVWFGLGMMGMVGWSVAVPALLGAALGSWLDKNYPQTFSWTLTFLLVGLITGSIIAWYWVANEDKEMHEDDNNENDE
jgi:ATP synthase protein I